MKHNPKTMIKSAFANKIHKLLKAYGEKWYKEEKTIDFLKMIKILRQTKDEDLTPEGKLLKEIFVVYLESSKELTSYLKKKRNKKTVQKLRLEKKQKNAA